MRDSGHKPSRFAGLKKIGSSLLRLFGGDFPVFLLFLGITFLIWWSQTMSQSFEAQMKLPVEIVGIPDDVRVTTPATDHISVMLSGKGSALRKSGRRSGHSVLRLNSRSFTIGHGHAALSTQSLRDSVMARVHASVSIRSIEPDSLVFLFARQRSVMLPVEYEVVTESQDQFFLERVELRPGCRMWLRLRAVPWRRRALRRSRCPYAAVLTALSSRSRGCLVPTFLQVA